MTILLEKGHKLLMIGDSITDCGRARPYGTRASGLGDGYAALVDGLLTATYPQLTVKTINVGISGNTVRDLARRWQSDVLDLSPNWLSIMIGANDVWRQFDSATDPTAGVFPDEFSSTLTRLISMTKPYVSGFSLLTPFYVVANKSDPMRAKMDEYGALVKAIAEVTQVYFGNTQVGFDKALESLPPYALAPDKVHPSLPGHTILARTFLDTIEYEW